MKQHKRISKMFTQAEWTYKADRQMAKKAYRSANSKRSGRANTIQLDRKWIYRRSAYRFFVWWETTRKRGAKGAKNRMLPRNRIKSNP